MKTVRRILTFCLVSLLADLCPLFAAQPGQRLWEFQVGDKDSLSPSVNSSPAIAADGTVYVGAAFLPCSVRPEECLPTGRVYRLNGTTGRMLWQSWCATMQASPAIGAAGTVYAGYYGLCYLVQGRFSALDAATGYILWSFPHEEFPNWFEYFTPASAAIGEDGTVYVGGAGKPYALDGATGRLLWESAAGGVIGSSPAIGADGTVYVGSYDFRVYALDGASGRICWEFRTGNYVYSSPAIGEDGTVYVGSTDDKVYALNGVTGQTRWEFRSGGAVYSSPSIGADGTVYVGSDDCKLYALDGATGRRLWESPTGGPVRSSPAVGADGTVYVGSHDHKVYALDGTTGQKLWDFMTGGPVLSSPAIGADGTVYVGSEDGKVYAICSSVGGLARSPWPKFRHDAQNTGRYTAPPTIAAKQPSLVVLKQGQEGRITVQVSGGPVPRVRWYFNSEALPGNTNATLSLPSATRALEGTYWLIASNALGRATSAPIVAVVSNVDPERFVTFDWPGREGSGVTLESAAGVTSAAPWHSLSNYPPAATEQRFVELAATASAGFYRLRASGTPPAMLQAGFLNGWRYTAPAGTQHRIDYTAESAGWTNWLVLTNLVLPTTPYLFLDNASLGAPARVYRTTPAP